MTKPLNDFGTALDVRDVIRQVIREELRKEQLQPRWARVYDINWENCTAQVIFPGDTEIAPVQFSPNCAPSWGLNSDPTYPYDPSLTTQVAEPTGGFLGDLVKIEGATGRLWITEIVYNSPRYIQALPLAANWTVWGAGFNGQSMGADAVRYWRRNGYVYLDGLVKWTSGSATTGNQNIGNLPAGYRPGFYAMFPAVRSDFAADSRVSILSTGAVNLNASGLATNGFVSLSGIRFLAEL